MDKVIVERPRSGRSWTQTGRGKYKLDPDLLQIGLKKAVKVAGPYKSLNENLAPLRRYLAAQVNRPWDKVWSEISANLKPSSTVQQHVRDHVPDFVAFDTRLIEGKIWAVGGRRYSAPRPLEKCGALLYVDPRSGLLRKNPHYRRWAAARREEKARAIAARDLRLREAGPTRQYHLFNDGAWWEVTLAPIVSKTVDVETKLGKTRQFIITPFHDVVDGTGLSDLPMPERYGREDVYASAKRQMSKRDMRAAGLR